MRATGIGASVKRKEDFRFLTGRGNYTDDINQPNQTYAYILRSPHAHAKIKGIDTAAAKTWWEALYTAAGESIDLTVGTELSGTGSGKNELNLFSVTSTTVQHGDYDNTTQTTAMDTQVMTKQ